MERAKRAFSDLVHLQVPKDRVKSHQQSEQEPQPPNTPGPIMESPASYRSRSFEYSLLVPKPEGENNVAVETVETAPVKDTHSPFKPINPLQMCAPLVRPHTHSPHPSSVLKSKQTFASPRTPNPGVLTPNARHTLSGILDHDLICASARYLISLLPRLIKRSTASSELMENLLGCICRSWNGLPLDIILLAAAFLVRLPSAIKIKDEWELACAEPQPMNDLFDAEYDEQDNPGRSSRPAHNQIKPITFMPTFFRPPSALPKRSPELLILASIAIAAHNITPPASQEAHRLTYWTLQIAHAEWTEEEFLVADKILGRLIVKQSNQRIVKADLDNRATELLWFCVEQDGCAVTF